VQKLGRKRKAGLQQLVDQLEHGAVQPHARHQPLLALDRVAGVRDDFQGVVLEQLMTLTP
jgi:hypothetical protein